MTAQLSKIQEWQAYWYLPLVAALGYATSTLFVYSMGPFFEPLQESFNWSRAQVSLGVSTAALLTSIFCIPLGFLVDRNGPRKVGLIGVLLVCGSYSMLGTATGSEANWIFLWSVIAIAMVATQTTVWTSAVNSRFHASRGMALAVTLSGASVAVSIFPVLATYLIAKFGWRDGFTYLGFGWAALVFPILFLGFRGANDTAADEKEHACNPQNAVGLTFKQGVRSGPMIKLLIGSSFFAFTAVAIVMHFVPILKDSGVASMEAAGIASLIGLCSIIGRLGTGFLLDRFPGHLVGTVAFALPLVGCSLLLIDSGNPTYQVIAACVFGLTLGSDVDVIAYLAAKYFGMRNFGALFGVLVMALSLGTAFGPTSAGAVYDRFGSYEPFLIATICMMGIASVGLFTLQFNKSADDILADEALEAEASQL